MSNTLAPSTIEQWKLWDARASQGYVSSGGLPAVPVASLTFAAFSCTGFVVGTDTDMVAVTQEAVAFTLPGSGDGTYWLLLYRDTNTDPGAWSRSATTASKSTNYRTLKSATRPTRPAGGLILAQVTVAGGVITAVLDLRVPASYVFAGHYDISDPLYGAVGDNSTDNAATIQAVANAVPDGSVVWVPQGTFLVASNIHVGRSNLTIDGTGAGSILKAKAGFVDSGAFGVLALGYSPLAGHAITAVASLTVRNLTLDGNSLAAPLFGVTCSNSLVDRVFASNSTKAGIAFVQDSSVGSNITVQNSVVTAALGDGGTNFGDGIYFGGIDHGRILNNTITNFTRLGIVSEAQGGVKSVDPLIQGNSCDNAHDNVGAETNGAIWVENTSGARIIGNTGYNLTNSNSTVTRGINIGFGGATGSRFELIGNVMSGVQMGLSIQPNSTDTVVVDQFSLRRGTIANYLYGVFVASGSSVLLSHLDLGDNDFTSAPYGSVVVTLALDLGVLSISDSIIGSRTYTDKDSADINVTALNGHTFLALTMDKLLSWKTIMRSPNMPTQMRVTNSHLYYDSGATYKALGALTSLTMSLSTLEELTGSGNNNLAIAAAGLYNFVKVRFVSADLVASLTSGAAAVLNFYDCSFSASSITLDGIFEFVMDGGDFSQYPAGGAIQANFTNHTLNMWIRNTMFRRTTDITPLQVLGFQPTSLLLNDVVRTSNITTLSTMTPAATGFTVTNVLP